MAPALVPEPAAEVDRRADPHQPRAPPGGGAAGVRAGAGVLSPDCALLQEGQGEESAKAAEIEDEKKKLDPGDATQGAVAASTSSMPDKELDKTHPTPDKKNRPKDVFGRSLPTEQEFEVLKNAPRLDTGAPARVKPFGVEVRNVRCLRCGNYGHQSGDRECPMKDVIMPNEESRLKRDDPLTAIMAQTDSSEPLKWELKQKPGMSPPRGGYNPDDPNQQIVAEDIFDEYGGFLGDIDIPALLTNFSACESKKPSKSKSRHKQSDSVTHGESVRCRSSYHSSSDSEPDKSNRTSRSKRKKIYCSDSSYSDAEVEAGKGKGKQKSKHRHKKKHLSESSSDSEDEVDTKRYLKKEDRKKKKHLSESSSDSEDEVDTKRHSKKEDRKKKKHLSKSSSDSEVEVDTRWHPKREHRKEMEIAPSSFSRDKRDTVDTVSKRHSSRSREKHHYSDSSSSEDEWHSTRRKDKQYYSDSSSSQSNRRLRRSRRKKYRSDSDSPEINRHSQRLKEKRHYTDLRTHESNRHSRRPREKRRYSDSSASDYSGSDRHNKRRHRRRN